MNRKSHKRMYPTKEMLYRIVKVPCLYVNTHSRMHHNIQKKLSQYPAYIMHKIISIAIYSVLNTKLRLNDINSITIHAAQHLAPRYCCLLPHFALCCLCNVPIAIGAKPLDCGLALQEKEKPPT